MTVPPGRRVFLGYAGIGRDGPVQELLRKGAQQIGDTGWKQRDGTEHRVDFTVSATGVIKPDTTYFFKVTHKDVTGVRPDLTNDPAPYPPFFTGAQAIGPVVVEPGPDNAEISWDANVIGSGRVEYGPTTAYGQTVDDAQNVADHSITLTLLQPATTYFFRVSNRHAIDGGSLAEQTGSFTTLSSSSYCHSRR